NAQRLEKQGKPGQQSDAKMVRIAIAAERRRRREIEDERRVAALAAIAEKVRDKGLFDRVVFAFTEMPPEDWAVEALKVVADNPDQDFNVLAAKIGKAGGTYMNLAIGTLCADREV